MNNFMQKSDTRPSYLFVIASSCQMYSGTGTAIYDWIVYAGEHYRFSILMDTLHEGNFSHTLNFCRKHNIELISSPAFQLPGCPDSGIRRVADVLTERDFDIIECVSWANAATNVQVLANLSPSTLLLYTPHTQPLWTLGEPTRFPLVGPVFEKMARRSDTIFIDTPSEARLPLFEQVGAVNSAAVPLGVDTDRFDNAGLHRANQLLCVCDCREPRKRIDLLLRAFELAHREKPQLRLTLAGKGSDLVAVPEAIQGAVSRHGYVSESQLVDLYNDCSLFVLLSDFEAFGLPIAEALCTGAPVLLNNQDATQDLFMGEPGVYWADNTDSQAVADLMCSIKTNKKEHQRISRAARRKFKFSATYGQKLKIVENLLRDSKT